MDTTLTLEPERSTAQTPREAIPEDNDSSKPTRAIAEEFPDQLPTPTEVDDSPSVSTNALGGVEGLGLENLSASAGSADRSGSIASTEALDANAPGDFPALSVGLPSLDALFRQSLVPHGGLVNLEFACDDDSHSFLLDSCRQLAKSGRRADFISIAPFIENIGDYLDVPSISIRYPLPARFTNWMENMGTGFSTVNELKAESNSLFDYLPVGEFATFISKLCALLNQPERPHVIVVEGLDSLFQQMRLLGMGSLTIRPQYSADASPEEIGHAKATAETRGILASLDNWLQVYSLVCQSLGVSLWISCWHGTASEKESVDVDLFYRELRPTLQRHCPAQLQVSLPQAGTNENFWTVALSIQGVLQGEANVTLPAGVRKSGIHSTENSPVYSQGSPLAAMAKARELAAWIRGSENSLYHRGLPESATD